MDMARVLTGDFNHETNTFSLVPTGVAAFEAYFAVTGEEIAARFRDVNHEQAGFFDCAAEFGWDLVPTVVASANPGGTVTAEAFERYAGLILHAARTQGPWDGVALSLHGAMVAEGYRDAEGEILRRLRTVVGGDVPIAMTLDLHANVSPDMAALADIVVSYKTYPHVDMRAAASHAGRLLQQAMQGHIRPRTLRMQPPQLEGLDGGRTDAGPMPALIEKARAWEGEPGILAVSLNAGFALADTPYVGPSVTVTYDQPAEDQARAIAADMALAIWNSRDVVSNTYLTPAQAVAKAQGLRGHGKPVIIADYADNPGAGGYGDATNLLAAMLDAKVENACFGALCDPQAASALHGHPVGAELTLPLGGKVDAALGGGPLVLTGRVMGLFDGRHVFEGPMYQGLSKSFGPTAVFRVDGVDILVTSHNMQILDRMNLAAFGIDPAAKSIIALKSMQHFRAAFEPLAHAVLVCDSGALARPSRSTLPFRNVRRPIHPLDRVHGA